MSMTLLHICGDLQLNNECAPQRTPPTLTVQCFLAAECRLSISRIVDDFDSNSSAHSKSKRVADGGGVQCDAASNHNRSHLNVNRNCYIHNTRTIVARTLVIVSNCHVKQLRNAVSKRQDPVARAYDNVCARALPRLMYKRTTLQAE
jgi:hypothetical protein